MYEYLNDQQFLLALDKLKIRIKYAKIVLLDFQEQVIKEIQGSISSGTLTVNGSAAIRRTINLTMLANPENNNLENINNDISVNKKIKVYIGYDNPLKEYANYGEIIWFPCGLFIISNANISRNVNSWNITINGKDKMSLLNGSAGGTLLASTTFHESYIYDEDDNITVYNPTLIEIIREAVHHLGGDDYNNIYINDLEETTKMLVKYIGDTPIYFNENYSSFSWQPSDVYINKYSYNDDVGYKPTKFTYPGELILNAGDTVITLLDKIKNILGNYEYFYDVEGRFIFQQQKNYLNINSPLLELDLNDYVQSYSNRKYLYSFNDLDTINSIAVNPNYENIKNDFIVWGKRTTAAGAEIDIRYHLTIDTKPDIYYASKYMYKVDNADGSYYYQWYDNKQGNDYICTPVYDKQAAWREELYRLALIASSEGNTYSIYDAELLAEWRNLFDPMNENWKQTKGWNPDVLYNPKNLNYWLEIIDDGTSIGKYSINMIGRRTKVINDNNIKSIYNNEVPDVVFLTNEEYDDLKEHYNLLGQPVFKWATDQMYNMFVTSSTGYSAFDKIRELLYLNLCYNTQITIQCVPKYYLEPNNILYIEDVESNVIGNYSITQFTLPLTYNGTMTITATEVLARV